MQRSSPMISTVLGAFGPVFAAFRHDLQLSVNMLHRIFRKSATTFGRLFPCSARAYPVSFPEYPQSLNAISSVYPLLIQPSFPVLNRNLERLSPKNAASFPRLSPVFVRSVYELFGVFHRNIQRYAPEMAGTLNPLLKGARRHGTIATAGRTVA